MNPHGHRHGFSLHRLEAFSDAVFAFAVTLLVVSLEVPHSAQELFHAMRGFLAFGICFGFLVMVWWDHHSFFRDYPLTDGRTLVLNMVLLFVVLLYVYPMKFLFTTLVDGMIFGRPVEGIQSIGEVKTLMVVYGLGFLAVNGVLALMHLHAWRRRAGLRLAPFQQARLRGRIRAHAGTCAVAGLSILIARFTSDRGSLAGWTYFLLAPLHTFNGMWTGRQERLAAAPEAG